MKANLTISNLPLQLGPFEMPSRGGLQISLRLQDTPFLLL